MDLNRGSRLEKPFPGKIERSQPTEATVSGGNFGHHPADVRGNHFLVGRAGLPRMAASPAQPFESTSFCESEDLLIVPSLDRKPVTVRTSHTHNVLSVAQVLVLKEPHNLRLDVFRFVPHR